MKSISIQTRILLLVSTVLVAGALLFFVMSSLKVSSILEDDSETIMLSASEYYTHVINDSLESTEQSVTTLYNYAIGRVDKYDNLFENEKFIIHYTYDVAELGKTIAQQTVGAMAVYLRYDPEKFGPTAGFWYTIDFDTGKWNQTSPTDMSLYEKDDIQHVGWYYIPMERGQATWMEPYYNANLGVNMISYIIPFYYEDEPIGIVGMDINMDILKHQVSQINAYETGHAFLVDEAGDVIYHRKYPNGISNSSILESDRHFFKDILELEQDKPTIFTGLNGVEQKVVTNELRNGMLLCLAAPVSDITRPQRVLLTQMLITSLIILLVSMTVTYTMIKTVTNPLKKMTRIAKQYAEGDFEEEIATEGDDEVGILSRTLQAMSTGLKEQAEIADQASQTKTRFLSTMSHEIRTPINVIMGLNEMIGRNSKEKQTVEYTMGIRKAGNVLINMVDSILAFSKLESVGDLSDYDFLGKDSYVSQNIDIQYQINGAKVLLVDDNEINCKIADNLLNIVGVYPDIAYSGLDAIDKCRANEYHIIFLDHMMPDLDGIETLHALRRGKIIPQDTKVIVMTANAIEGAKDYYLGEGFDYYLAKPVELRNLMEVLLKFLPKELFSESHDAVLEFEPVKMVGEEDDDSKADDDLEKTLMLSGVNMREGLKYCVGNLAFYKEMLGDYANACQKKIVELDKYENDADLKNYQILIHSIKSASKTIGAESMYQQALDLEEAAKEQNAGKIKEEHRHFAENYVALGNAISEAIGGLI
ncbi:MAG: response regulator [Butyrivibrio sp.]|nr:response regulator [Butyrivibrio sp.]